MLPHEREEMIDLLCKQWPSMFADNADLLDAFLRKVDPYTFASVKQAVLDWKLENRFAPTIVDIRPKLVKSGCGEGLNPSDTPYQTLIAKQVAEANPHLKGRCEEELILRYHRWLLNQTRFRRRQGFERLPDNLKSEMKDQNRDEDRRDIHYRKLECSRDLFAVTQDVEKSNRLSDWIDSPKHEFDATMLQMREVPV